MRVLTKLPYLTPPHPRCSSGAAPLPPASTSYPPRTPSHPRRTTLTTRALSQHDDSPTSASAASRPETEAERVRVRLLFGDATDDNSDPDQVADIVVRVEVDPGDKNDDANERDEGGTRTNKNTTSTTATTNAATAPSSSSPTPTPPPTPTPGDLPGSIEDSEALVSFLLSSAASRWGLTPMFPSLASLTACLSSSQSASPTFETWWALEYVLAQYLIEVSQQSVTEDRTVDLIGQGLAAAGTAGVLAWVCSWAGLTLPFGWLGEGAHTGFAPFRLVGPTCAFTALSLGLLVTQWALAERGVARDAFDEECRELSRATRGVPNSALVIYFLCIALAENTTRAFGLSLAVEVFAGTNAGIPGLLTPSALAEIPNLGLPGNGAGTVVELQPFLGSLVASGESTYPAPISLLWGEVAIVLAAFEALLAAAPALLERADQANEREWAGPGQPLVGGSAGVLIRDLSASLVAAWARALDPPRADLSLAELSALRDLILAGERPTTARSFKILWEGIGEEGEPLPDADQRALAALPQTRAALLAEIPISELQLAVEDGLQALRRQDETPATLSLVGTFLGSALVLVETVTTRALLPAVVTTIASYTFSRYVAEMWVKRHPVDAAAGGVEEGKEMNTG